MPDAAPQVPLEEIRFRFVRASGPGGQNVNKVASKAILRWNVRASLRLSEEQKERLTRLAGSRMTRAGELLITSGRFRDQARNAAECLARLRGLLAEAAVVPKPRRPTRPTRASQEKRLKGKRIQSDKKRSRRRVEGE